LKIKGTGDCIVLEGNTTLKGRRGHSLVAIGEVLFSFGGECQNSNGNFVLLDETVLIDLKTIHFSVEMHVIDETGGPSARADHTCVEYKSTILL